jgi:hypothetical protein
MRPCVLWAIVSDPFALLVYLHSGFGISCFKVHGAGAYLCTQVVDFPAMEAAAPPPDTSAMNDPPI